MEEKSGLTIGIFEDNPALSHGVMTYLVNELGHPLNVLFSSTDPEEFIENLTRQDPDMLIMDIISEGVWGLELFERVFAADKNACVIAYSNVKSQRIIKGLLELGVSAYIPKTDPLSSFNLAFESILFDRRIFLPNDLEHLRNSKNVFPPIVLTSREKQVLMLLVKGKSSKEIANELFVSTNTADFHKKNLFSKFQVRSIAELVKEAIASGYNEGLHYL